MNTLTHFLHMYQRPIVILALSLFVAGGTLLLSMPVNSQGGPGQCCTSFCGMEPPCGGDITLTCADLGATGTWPDCVWPAEPTCADSGLLGTYPNCYAPPQPTCADSGLLGTYPNCYAPPQPTCADSGLLGTYPNCYAPPQPTCADVGLLGSWPNCYAPPEPTCADYGQLGTYPNCYAPPQPTCADSGQLGTYPNCYDAPGGGDPPASVTLSANPTSITAGNSSTLTWTASNATSCTGGGFSTGGSTGSTRSVSPATTQTYTIQCSGPGGDDTDDATVTVTGAACQNNGTLEITAAPSRIQPGEDVVLSWSAGADIAAASCTVTNLSTGAVLDSANASACSVGDETTPVNDLQAQTTFRLTCGTLTKDVTVNVVPRFEEF